MAAQHPTDPLARVWREAEREVRRKTRRAPPAGLDEAHMECTRREVVELRRRVFRLVRVLQGRRADRGLVAKVCQELADWDLDSGALPTARDLAPRERRSIAARLAGVGPRMRTGGPFSHWPERARGAVAAALQLDGPRSSARLLGETVILRDDLSDHARRFAGAGNRRGVRPRRGRPVRAPRLEVRRRVLAEAGRLPRVVLALVTAGGAAASRARADAALRAEGDYLGGVRIETFVQRSRMPASAEEVFRWHESPDALARLTPPGAGIEVVEPAPSLRDGARAVLRVRVGPFWRRWVAVHEGYVEGRRFADRQVEGPFAHWLHTHSVEPAGPGASILEDRIEWALPLGWLGRFLGGWQVRRNLRRTFAWRHAATAAALAERAGVGR